MRRGQVQSYGNSYWGQWSMTEGSPLHEHTRHPCHCSRLRVYQQQVWGILLPLKVRNLLSSTKRIPQTPDPAQAFLEFILSSDSKRFDRFWCWSSGQIGRAAPILATSTGSVDYTGTEPLSIDYRIQVYQIPHQEASLGSIPPQSCQRPRNRDLTKHL